jgi:DNA polymerase III sliding clamp (beta) subunit (PCNA family)
MKVKSEKQELFTTLTLLERIVPLEPPSQLLKNILIRVGEKIEMFATDLLSSLVIEVEGEIEKEGECLVPVILLRKLIINLSGVIALELKGKNLAIKTEDSSLSIKTLSSEGYPLPVLPNNHPSQFSLLEISEVLPIVKQAAAAPNDMTGGREEYAVVNFQSKGRGLRLSATNGHRLTVAMVSVKGKKRYDFSLPTASVEILSRLAAISSGESFYFDLEKAVFFCLVGKARYATGVSVFKFPGIEPLIPSEFSYQFNCKRDDVQSALVGVDQVGPFNHSVRVLLLDRGINTYSC